MFDNICSLPLTSDLFAQAVHPTEPLVAVGQLTGHVATLRLPPAGTRAGTIATAWRTKRHAGSCRGLGFSADGRTLFSAGADGVVKAAETGTGVVRSKVVLPMVDSNTTIDAPTVLHVLSPQTLLVGTDAAALHVYDLRIPAGAADGTTWLRSSRPQQTFKPHGQAHVAALTPFPPSEASTSGYARQWASVGGGTLAVTDLRKGTVATSEDVGAELLCVAHVPGSGRKGRGDWVLVGGGEGEVMMWERGQWEGWGERMHVGAGQETVEAVVVMEEGVGGVAGPVAAVGMGMGEDGWGRVKLVDVNKRKVVGVLGHEVKEDVAAVGYDVGGRLITGGGCVLKVWHELGEEEGEEGEEEEEDGNGQKRAADSEDEEDSSDDDSDSSMDGRRAPQVKKARRGNLPNGGMEELAFDGLD